MIEVAINEQGRHQCMSCGTDDVMGYHWLIVDQPTIGGDILHVCLCWDCRRNTGYTDGGPWCDGRCGGGYKGVTGWSAECLTCRWWAEEEYSDEELMFNPVTGPTWSCLEQECVQSWVEQHRGQQHKRANIRVVGPWEPLP